MAIKPKLREAAFLLVSLSVGLASAERLLGQPAPQSRDVAGSERMYEFNARLGWQLVANKRLSLTMPEGMTVPVMTNSASMRDREYSLQRPLAKRRIAVLGDSYVIGLGESDSEVMTKVLEGVRRVYRTMEAMISLHT